MIASFVGLLVVHYFPLSIEDLEEWKEDPEEFALEEEIDSYQEKKRVV